MQKIKILIIDDDKYFRMALKDLLKDYGLITEADCEEAALDLCQKEFFDIALIDMNIDGPLSGLKILKKTKSLNIHSIILSSETNEEVIEEAYESGCDHFLSKFKYREYLAPYIRKYIKNYLNNDLETFFQTQYITHNHDLKRKIKELCKINLKNKTIFITGETGVGKSLIGELLHRQTYEDENSFIHLNCAEVPEDLIESELFGHEKGAFTGAINKKVGKLELASGGTLFLDEIATMPLSMQKKLLKALDQKIFYPLGAEKPVQVEFTLITATCEDLFEKIAKDEFRKDLFYRVSGLNLDIPPLRDRQEDIPFLIKFFLQRSHRRFIIKEEALQIILKHSWKGNIRELKKFIDILSSKEKGIIKAEDIIFSSKTNGLLESQTLTSAQKNYIQKNGLRDFIKTVEEESLKEVLEKNQGKINQTIKELKISASAFYRIFNQIS